ncbi:MAG: IS3 family transposase [Anaerovoracaceae bacterium]|uniref:IS3 family transposase n=1 Tax=Niameybacter sp. TaxID=2033640 RepID=UPI002FC8D37D
MKTSSTTFEIIENCLKDVNNAVTVSTMCEMAGVSRSGYYAWLKAAQQREARELQDRKDFEIIIRAYKKSGYAKGAQSIYMDLIHMEPPVVMNLKKIRRLMKKYNLVCPIRKKNPYKQLARDLKTNMVADNLLKREFEAYGPRVVLLTDITYIPYNGTFAYLSTIIDAFTKQILSYVISGSLKVDFVLETVEQLIDNHGISMYEETIIHSDQGCHYTSNSFQNIVKNKCLRQSMSRRGNCWDNAPQESFFGHMKDHIGKKLESIDAYENVKMLIDDYIEYYNNDRYQWHLAKLSPNEFYSFCVTGIYPLDITNAPEAPTIYKDRKELGKIDEQ